MPSFVVSAVPPKLTACRIHRPTMLTSIQKLSRPFYVEQCKIMEGSILFFGYWCGRWSASCDRPVLKSSEAKKRFCLCPRRHRIFLVIGVVCFVIFDRGRIDAVFARRTVVEGITSYQLVWHYLFPDFKLIGHEGFSFYGPVITDHTEKHLYCILAVVNVCISNIT